MSQDSKFHHGDVPKDAKPIIHMENIQKHFGNVIALNGVTFDVTPGECHCLLGDNGAGKSTFIKTMSGVHKPTAGKIFFEGKPLAFDSPRDAMEAGIATVFQDLAMIPLMSVTRNFFMGREPTKGRGIAKRFDIDRANEICMEEMRKMGINLRAPDQAVVDAANLRPPLPAAPLLDLLLRDLFHRLPPPFAFASSGFYRCSRTGPRPP